MVRVFRVPVCLIIVFKCYVYSLRVGILARHNATIFHLAEWLQQWLNVIEMRV